MNDLLKAMMFFLSIIFVSLITSSLFIKNTSGQYFIDIVIIVSIIIIGIIILFTNKESKHIYPPTKNDGSLNNFGDDLCRPDTDKSKMYKCDSTKIGMKCDSTKKEKCICKTSSTDFEATCYNVTNPPPLCDKCCSITPSPPKGCVCDKCVTNYREPSTLPPPGSPQPYFYTIKNKDNTYTNMAVPKGNWWLPTKIKTADCNQYTGDYILENTPDGIIWGCKCKYPEFAIGSDCSTINACHGSTNKNQIYCPKDLEKEHICENGGLWTTNSDWNPIYGKCECGKGEISSTYYANDDLIQKECSNDFCYPGGTTIVHGSTKHCETSYPIANRCKKDGKDKNDCLTPPKDNYNAYDTYIPCGNGGDEYITCPNKLKNYGIIEDTCNPHGYSSAPSSSTSGKDNLPCVCNDGYKSASVSYTETSVCIPDNNCKITSKCGANGTCYKDIYNTEHCICNFPYIGDNCDKSLLSTGQTCKKGDDCISGLCGQSHTYFKGCYGTNTCLDADNQCLV